MPGEHGEAPIWERQYHCASAGQALAPEFPWTLARVRKTARELLWS
uniref:Uncharacterized protein n=1 Tax=Pseudomonas aeruginosa TaxID=287 RepID=A0A2L1KF56_PSEAI|nr:Hypothetical protein [Pseudomonas aeruginosa]